MCNYFWSCSIAFKFTKNWESMFTKTSEISILYGWYFSFHYRCSLNESTLILKKFWTYRDIRAESRGILDFLSFFRSTPFEKIKQTVFLKNISWISLLYILFFEVYLKKWFVICEYNPEQCRNDNSYMKCVYTSTIY